MDELVFIFFAFLMCIAIWCVIQIVKAIQISKEKQMFCKHCGTLIKDGVQFCPVCGKDTGIPASKMMSSKRRWEETYKKRCAKCGCEDLKMETVVESKSMGCFPLILSLMFLGILVFIFPLVNAIAIPIVIIIILIYIFKKKSRTVTYATCQNCGARWRTY